MDSADELWHTQRLCLGDLWVPIFETAVDFDSSHFHTAMSHLIREPNINSTVILRADIMVEEHYGEKPSSQSFMHDLPSSKSHESSEMLMRDLADVDIRLVPLDNATVDLKNSYLIVRRIIPRNPYKDHIINQTCSVLDGENARLVVYLPHVGTPEEIPFYIPPVKAVGILYHQNKVSVHYMPFNEQLRQELCNSDTSERPIRIALRLLQTLVKHSAGAKAGYSKRVNHDLVVPRVAFQNRYIELKKKYSAALVAGWVESTDPKKHVFEDLAVAAFLIELWAARYRKSDFQFCDMGCGNGLLVHILISEGYKGMGIDARARKSWKTYPENVQKNLREQIIIPKVLLKPHPMVSQVAPHVRDNGRLFQVPEYEPRLPKQVPLMKYYSSANLLESLMVCTTEEFAPNTFLIGNHLDELTCWLPLFGYPFIVIPCCSHALNGAKIRYNPRRDHNSLGVSTYGALVDHVEELASRVGWDVEKEILRIPSTRNTAIIGMNKLDFFASEADEVTDARVMEIVASEGGAEGWVENLMLLLKKSPKNH